MSETIGKLAEALSKAQGEMTGAVKSKQNPFFKSSYADLAACWDAARAPLSKHGLSVSQTTEVSEAGTVILVTSLLHSSGEHISGKLPVKPVKDDPQSMGSALTYARRYGFCAIVGVAPADEDDDGEGAMDRGGEKKPKGKKPQDTPLGPTLTREQQKGLHAYIEEKKLSPDTLKAELKEMGLDSTSRVLQKDLGTLTTALKAHADQRDRDLGVDEVFGEEGK